jgi:hypothetical protein
MPRYRSSSAVTVVMLAIYDKHGTVTPQLVVEEATPSGSPIHHYFEWNDDIAADQYRLTQAGALIRSCRVNVKSSTGDEMEIRQFVSIRSPSSPSNYVPVAAVIDPISQRLVLDSMQRDIGHLITRYGHLEAFWKAMGGLTPPTPPI